MCTFCVYNKSEVSKNDLQDRQIICEERDYYYEQNRKNRGTHAQK